MKRSLSLVCLLASGLSVAAIAQAAAPANSDPAPAAAAAVPPSASTRIAIIQFQGAVAQTNEFQRDLADLRKKYEPQEAKIQADNQEVETLKKQLQDGGANVSDVERQNKMRTIDDKTKTLQRAAQDLQSNEQQDGQETFNQVANKVGEVMISYAQQQGFNLVLDAGQQNSNVLWATPSTDITKAVIEAYNAKSGVPAPPTPVPSAPAPRSTTPGATHTTPRTPPATPHK
ncbi:MAG TPA: OmpH family outer membrane protein [Acidobacteriaceae bacterium]|nr:OmpH family outer membrane protein [Acidobacteriaceae bacterium]